MNRLTNRSPKNVDLFVLCVCVFFKSWDQAVRNMYLCSKQRLQTLGFLHFALGG